MTQRFVIAGCGYTGRRLALRLRDDADVLCIARTAATCASLRDAGLDAVAADLGAPGTAAAARGGDSVIYLAPPPPDGGRDTTLEGYLAAAAQPARFVYASTSGVYGDCGGALVDESRPPAPQTARAQRRVAAERALQDWAAGRAIVSVVLRVAGIYGPGRLPLERIRRREPVLRDADAGPGNRIHVDDLVSALRQAATTAAPPSPVNVSDGNHLNGTAFTLLVARLAGLPAPPQIGRAEAQRVFTAMRWSFLAESRRLDNTRLREQLGVRLRYAEPADGIRAALEEQPD